MIQFFSVLFTTIYVLLAVRVADVTNQACICAGKEPAPAAVAVFSAIWPIGLVIVGGSTIFFDEPPQIYGHCRRLHHAP